MSCIKAMLLSWYVAFHLKRGLLYIGVLLHCKFRYDVGIAISLLTSAEVQLALK